MVDELEKEKDEAASSWNREGELQAAQGPLCNIHFTARWIVSLRHVTNQQLVQCCGSGSARNRSFGLYADSDLDSESDPGYIAKLFFKRKNFFN